MIQAFFRTSEGVFIPALVPDGDVLDLARTMGLSESDLFRIDIPSGATRPARITVLVKQSDLSTCTRAFRTERTQARNSGGARTHWFR